MKSQVKRRRGARGIGPLIAVAFVVVATLIAGVRPAGAAEVGSADALSGVSARGGNYDDLLSADSGYTPESGGFSSNIGLSATLTLAHDPKAPLKAGDTFSFGLVPDDEFAAKFWYVYNSDQMKFRSVLDESTDEEIATISWSSNNTLTLTFTEAAEGKSEVRCSFSSIPFTYTPRDIYNWFSANKDSERIHQTPEGRRYVDVTYHLTVNGQRTDRAMTLRVLEPKGSQPTSASIEKRRGGLQPDGAQQQIQLPRRKQSRRLLRPEQLMTQPVHQPLPDPAERKMTNPHQRLFLFRTLPADQLLRRPIQKAARQHRIRRPRRIEHQKPQRPEIQNLRETLQTQKPSSHPPDKLFIRRMAFPVSNIRIMVPRRKNQRNSRIRQHFQILQRQFEFRRLPAGHRIPRKHDQIRILLQHPLQRRSNPLPAMHLPPIQQGIHRADNPFIQKSAHVPHRKRFMKIGKVYHPKRFHDSARSVESTSRRRS